MATTDFVVKNGLVVNEDALIKDTTDSSSKDTGALIVEGGIGIEKNLSVGGRIITSVFPDYTGILIGRSDSDVPNSGAISVGYNIGQLGAYSIALGFEAGTNGNGSDNITIGQFAGAGAVGSSYTKSIAIGSSSGLSLTDGSYSTFIGDSTGASVTSGYQNTFIGADAGQSVTTGSYNVIIGSNNGSSIDTLDNHIIISDGGGNIRIQVNNSGTTTINGDLRVGGADAGPNYIAFRGTTGDQPGSYNHTYIGERIHTATESSELFIFKGNDPTASGPDRIRIAAADILFDTYTVAVGGADFETVATNANLLNRVIIKSNGNVGIGTNDPQRKLTVQSDSSGTITSVALYNANTTNNNGTVFSFRTDTIGTGATTFYEVSGFQSKTTEHDHATRNTNFAIFTDSATTGLTEKFTVTGLGRVGVGTNDPAELLDVRGNIALTGSIVFEGSTADGNETTLTVTDPTADNTITLPDATGTVAVSVSDTTTSTQGELNLDFTLSAAGNVSATGTAQGLSTSSTPAFAGLYSGNIAVRGGSGASSEGGQITIGYGNNTTSAITGQANNTWNIDVASGTANNDFRIFRQNSSGVTLIGLQIIESNGSVTFPANVASTSTTTGTVIVTGGVGISGALNATTKSFDIDHPTKPGMKLRYGSLEGPEFGVYVRGKLTNSNVIELPEYWTKLVDPDSITVQLTAIGQHQQLYVEKIENNTITVGGSSQINCFYVVHAERADVDKLVVEGE